MEMTREYIREMATSSDPIELLILLSAESSPVMQLAMAGQLVRMTEPLEHDLKTLRTLASPKHGDVRKAAQTAIDAAKLALEASVNMVYETNRVLLECPCLECVATRRRAEADNN